MAFDEHAKRGKDQEMKGSEKLLKVLNELLADELRLKQSLEVGAQPLSQ